MFLKVKLSTGIDLIIWSGANEKGVDLFSCGEEFVTSFSFSGDVLRTALQALRLRCFAERGAGTWGGKLHSLSLGPGLPSLAL